MGSSSIVKSTNGRHRHGETPWGIGVHAYDPSNEKARIIRQERKTNPAKYMVYSAKSRAKLYRIEFAITIDDIKIPERCPVLGIPLDGLTRKTTPSLDRRDNSKGYTPANICVISNAANAMKNNMTIKDCRAVLAYLEGRL